MVNNEIMQRLGKIGRYMADTVFPPSNNQLVVREIKSSELIENKLKPQSINGIISLLAYKDPVVQPLIQEAKFHYNNQAYNLLATILNKYLSCQPEEMVILPVPLSRQRYLKRGYNQVTEVAKRVAKSKNRIITTDLIVRHRHTKAQTSLEKSERLTNVKGAFRCQNTNPVLLKQKHLFVLDDVVTTGATLKAVRQVLPSGIWSSITLIALARS